MSLEGMWILLHARVAIGEVVLHPSLDVGQIGLLKMW